MRVLQGPVADVPAVEKEILHPRVAAVVARRGDVPGQLDLPVVALDRNQAVGQFLAKERRDPGEPTVAGRQIKQRPLVVP